MALVLTKEELVEAYNKGKEMNASHMIVKRNDMYTKDEVIYVLEDEDVLDVISRIMDPNLMIRETIDQVYNYDTDILEQLKANKRFNLSTEKSNKDLYVKALNYATNKHYGRKRKGSESKAYITHPVAVSFLVGEYMKDDDEKDTYMVAALLHDTIEDSGATFEDIKDKFGIKIAHIVNEVTNDKKEKLRLGKDVYLADKMAKMDDKVLILKLCDRLQNIDDVRYADKEFNEKYVRETSYIINYLLLNRKLNGTHLSIVNRIMNTVKDVSSIDPMIIKPRKMLLEKPTE